MTNKKIHRKPYQPSDLRHIKFVSDPRIHPTQDRVLYVVRLVDEDQEEDRYRSEIRQVNLKGKEGRVISATGMDSNSPEWSPDGSQLLFLSKRGGDEESQLYLMPADGGEARRLTEIEGGVRSARWSTDGRHVLFLSPVAETGEGGEEEEPFAEDVQVIESALWRLNGVGSFLEKRHHLFVVPARGGKPRQLTQGPWNVGGHFLYPNSYLQAGGEERVYYLASPDPGDDWLAARRMEVHSVGLDGADRRQLTEFGGVFLGLAWSPLGELVAIGNDLAHGWASPSRLYRIDPATGEHREVPIDQDLGIGDAINCDVRFTSRSPEPWISSDGKKARVRYTDRGAVRLAEVDLEAGGLEWLSGEGASVLAYDCPPQGEQWVEIRTTITDMPELWAHRREGKPLQLTALNKRLAASREALPARRLPFTASDGAQVESWALLPPGLPSGDGWPSVLAIHGGPKTVYGHAFMLEFQMLAGMGFGVLFCNPRGSDGYGTEWAEAVQGHYGERDYDDLMECVNHALSLELGLDPGSLGVSGGSYGGFMTNWIVGHTDRFRAAISQRGISNWDSFYGTSDIGYFFNPDHVGALPWEDPELYREKSPITYAPQVETPLLLIHSEQDLRCPIEQAEQFFVYLRRLGKEVKLARFPEDTHELSRSGTPSRRMERLRLILDWFQSHLMDLG